MIDAIIRFSVRQKLAVGLMVLVLIGLGLNALRTLPVDAVPDITNNQVQVVTVAPALAPQEVEQLITYPLEVAMANIPGVVEIRSLSRFSLSVITVVFEEQIPILDARQFVSEQINVAEEQIPAYLGKPGMMPITTGLGEIYQYVLRVKPGWEHHYSPMDLRTIQDWIVKRQLAGIAGIIEVSSFGGYLKQYEVALDPVLLESFDLSVGEVYEALASNNQNSGGSYIEKSSRAYYIRTEGMVENLEQIGQIVVATRGGIPILVRQVGEVRFGSPKRFGAMTMDGEGEAVGGIALMLKGANSSEAIRNVHDRIERVRRTLPEGIELYPYLDRSDLVAKTIDTVTNNLLEGGLIVIVVLILMLGNWRAGLIVASVIPLAMLFALFMMRQTGVSANLMSLGAIDFGIVVDGAVIIVEGVVHALVAGHLGQHLTRRQMDAVVVESSARLFRPAVFGVLIILVVFLPIMALTGIEGKMFRPMALTFSFAVMGAMILSLTYVPMMSSILLSKRISARKTLSERFLDGLRAVYLPFLRWALRVPYLVLGLALAALAGAFLLFRSLGAEFIPTLEEGDLAMQMTIPPGSSLEESIRTSTLAESILLEQFPEVEHVVSKIGTAEVPTDPMAIEDADIMIILKEKSAWTRATHREELVEQMKAALAVVSWASFEFTQPIQLRFNELMTGAKTDVAVKIFGEDTELLKELGDRAAGLIAGIPGAADVRVDQTEGLPQLVVRYDRSKTAEYGLRVADLNTLVRTAYAGETAGVVLENERKFDLVLRLLPAYRNDLDLGRLFVHLEDGRVIPLSEVAQTEYTEGPLQIAREGARRRIVVGVNVRDRDVAGLVADIQARLDADLDLPPGYNLQYGGEFEHLEEAQRRLAIAVPVALGLIVLLLYFTFGQFKYALLIFSAVPLSTIGGVLALWLRGMPFSISAGVGFIALFGVAVLNGIVLISHFNHLREQADAASMAEVVLRGASDRLRPVLMTATVAAFGFLPMALSTSSGAEVQKPLATVVIGGLVTATLLTLVVMPILYTLINKASGPGLRSGLVVAGLLLGVGLFGQEGGTALPAGSLTLQQALDSARLRHPALQRAAVRAETGRLSYEAERRIPPVELQLQGGQINSPTTDYLFSVWQALPRFGERARLRDLAESATELGERERAEVAHQIAYAVRLAWHAWHYAAERRRLLEGRAEANATLLELLGQQLDLGAITRLDYARAESQRTQELIELSTARREEDRAYRQLLMQAWLQGPFAPPAGPVEPLPLPDTLALSNVQIAPPAGPVEPLPLPDTLALSNVLVAPALQRVEVARGATAVAGRSAKPSLQLGYFNQSIRPAWALQGLQVGVSLPLFTGAQQAEREQARLEEVLAVTELQQVRRRVAVRKTEAYTQVQLLATQWDEQGGRLQAQANDLRALASQQLREGEVDFFSYLESLRTALENELARLELLDQLNRAILRLAYFNG